MADTIGASPDIVRRSCGAASIDGSAVPNPRPGDGAISTFRPDRPDPAVEAPVPHRHDAGQQRPEQRERGQVNAERHVALEFRGLPAADWTVWR
ncbi:hypothetical protein [Dactylosporangium sp. NPDC048998]|uniref:hypothetical protein n=1 Tax=Dactylosporangium sp. NPDC048998 TaxID=3363976 RepID=UPI00371957D1